MSHVGSRCTLERQGIERHSGAHGGLVANLVDKLANDGVQAVLWKREEGHYSRVQGGRAK